MPATLERTFTIDRDLARRVNRKLRRYGTDLNGLLSIVVSSRGLPFLPEPLSLEFVVDGKAKRPRRSARLAPIVQYADGLFSTCLDAIGLDAFAETREELGAEVKRQLAMLWKEYALADDATLTEAARKIKRNLLESFEADRFPGGGCRRA